MTLERRARVRLVSFWDWLKRYASNWGIGDAGGRSTDHHALIEIDLDKKKPREQPDDEPGRTGEPDDSVQAL